MKDRVEEAGVESFPASDPPPWTLGPAEAPRPKAADILRGTAVSPGVGRGAAYVLACAERAAAPQREVPASQVEDELARFHTALATAEQELLALKQSVSEKIGPGEADIFTAQAMVLSDATFRNQVTALVRDKQVNVEAALTEVIDGFTRTFDGIPDAVLRERAADIRDVGRRVLSALIERQSTTPLEIPDGAILVAEELLPSLTARLELGRVRAVVTERGGRFSHTSILARSLGMPAVAGVAAASLGIKTGDRLVVDGVSGVVFVNPSRTVEREYERLETAIRADKEKLRRLVDLPSVTRDGTTIGLHANVNKLADTEAALMYKADGIGLYRTEFAFSIRNDAPSEDDQYRFLKRAAERFHPRKVVFRLLDIGGDKQLPYLPLPASRNPALGERGIRLLLKHPHLLASQLRAFLRVSADHPVSILLPMVGGVDEVRETRRMVRRVQAELAAEGLRFDASIPIGAMIEVPAAALAARGLAREVDFFSLGTNDLVQYVTAADREDQTVASYYQPLHPAVLRLIALVSDAARDTSRPLTICGDMAGNPLYTELLLGLGLRELSVGPGELLDVKNRIRNTAIEEATAVARAALEAASAAEVEALLGASPSPLPAERGEGEGRASSETAVP